MEAGKALDLHVLAHLGDHGGQDFLHGLVRILDVSLFEKAGLAEELIEFAFDDLLDRLGGLTLLGFRRLCAQLR